MPEPSTPTPANAAREAEIPRPARRDWPTPAQRWVAAAALVLAVAFGAWQWSRYVRDSAWRDLAVARADYPLLSDEPGIAGSGERRAEGSTPPESAPTAVPISQHPSDDGFAQAIEPYLRGDYSVAELRLSAYLRQHPQDSAAALYRGVSLLLSARQLEAIAPLGRATRAGQEPVASEARWYLAQAYLKVGDSRAAGRELEKLAGGTSPRRLQARELLQRIKSN